MIRIGNKVISPSSPVFIIAEAGVNHNGSLRIAEKLIDVAAECGVDAVKFQTFNPDTLVTKNVQKAQYQKINERKVSERQYEMLKRLMLKRPHHKILQSYARKKGIIFLSTPFAIDDIDFLDELGVPAFKAGSTDTNNIPHLIHMAKKRKPIILSSGMATLREVAESVNAIKKAGNSKIIVLHCTTSYPTKPVDTNVRAMLTLTKKLGVTVGYSDHTEGNEAAIAAVTLGARVIEKHFTLSRKMKGPDHKASLEPNALNHFVYSIRLVERMLGSDIKRPSAIENSVAKVARKSLVALKNIKKGATLTKENIGLKRPGTGIPPKQYFSVLGKRAKVNISADTLLRKNQYGS